MRRADQDGCGTCHVKPDGGGARNDFGAAFDAATRDITPLLRAGLPLALHRRLGEAARRHDLLHGRSRQHRSWSSSAGTQRVVVNVADIATPKAAPLPPASNRMTFFVSSRGLEQGGRLGGLAGADRLCADAWRRRPAPAIAGGAPT